MIRWYDRASGEICIWYSPSEIIYNYDQNIWMIENILPLEYGKWKPEPLEAGKSQKGVSHSAPFEKICQVTGELRARLDAVPKDPKEALTDEIQMNTIKSHKQLSRPALRALQYISGKNRRNQTYTQWKKQKNYRDK